MASIQPLTMTGPFCRSWPCPMVPMRKASVLPTPRRADHGRATEDFSYFTLRRRTSSKDPATSVFGISCTRQIDSNELLHRPAEVTRSTVQKAVVAIADSPQFFGQLREKLSMVTGAWFAQKYGRVCPGASKADGEQGTLPTLIY